jgi:hypothetical protein
VGSERQRPSQRQNLAEPSYRAWQPDAEQTIRAGGSSPRLTTVSTGLRPWVLSASRVSCATSPFASWFIAARKTSTTVVVSRPSRVLDLTDQDAPMLCELGGSLVDSLTVHSRATLSP